jgi:hypothetical protein
VCLQQVGVLTAPPAAVSHEQHGVATSATATLAPPPLANPEPPWVPAACPSHGPVGASHPRIADMAGVSRKGVARGGGKPWNQDRGLLLEAWRTPGEALVGVCDGHGGAGHLVAAWLAGQLPGLLLADSLAEAALVPATPVAAGCVPGDGSDGSSSAAQGLGTPSAGEPRGPAEGLAWDLVAAATTATASAAAASGGYTPGGAPLVSPVARGSLLPPAWVAPSALPAAEPGSQRQAHAAPSLSSFSRCFRAADALLASNSGLPVTDSGSTAVLVHIGPDTLTSAWVGDSRAVLGRRVQGAPGHAGGARAAPVVAAVTTSSPGPDWMHLEGGEEVGRVACAPAATPISSGSRRAEALHWEAVPLTADHKPDRPDELVSTWGRGMYQHRPHAACVVSFRACTSIAACLAAYDLAVHCGGHASIHGTQQPF